MASSLDEDAFIRADARTSGGFEAFLTLVDTALNRQPQDA
jgi:hypothetical protein